jgi:hypothetical protein
MRARCAHEQIGAINMRHRVLARGQNPRADAANLVPIIRCSKGKPSFSALMTKSMREDTVRQESDWYFAKNIDTFLGA